MRASSASPASFPPTCRSRSGPGRRRSRRWWGVRHLRQPGPAHEAFLIERITDRTATWSSRGAAGERRAAADTAFILTSLLRGVAERAPRPGCGGSGGRSPARRHHERLHGRLVRRLRAFAGGRGLVGFDEKKDSLGRGETGSEAALPIWMEFWRAPPPIVPWRSTRSGQRRLRSGGRDGRPGAPGAGGVRMEAFVAGPSPVGRTASAGDSLIRDSRQRAARHPRY